MKIVGIVNTTPDSFSDGGQFATAQAAIDHALCLEDEGADLLDIGGESTRPGAAPVPLDEEKARVLPVLEGLADRVSTPLSIDTRKPEVAVAAVHAGASCWNDVTALRHAPESLATAAALGCEVIMMHMQGEPGTMQNEPRYANVVDEVVSFLQERITACEAVGVPPHKIIVDPGIGFGKSLEHNLALFRNLEVFQTLGTRVLVGASRKRFVAALDRDGPASERLGGSLAAALRAARAGATHVRVHDVAATRQALAVAAALNGPSEDHSSSLHRLAL